MRSISSNGQGLESVGGRLSSLFHLNYTLARCCLKVTHHQPSNLDAWLPRFSFPYSSGQVFSVGASFNSYSYLHSSIIRSLLFPCPAVLHRILSRAFVHSHFYFLRVLIPSFSGRLNPVSPLRIPDLLTEAWRQRIPLFSYNSHTDTPK